MEVVVSVGEGAGLLAVQGAGRSVRMERPIGRYVVDLADATRRHSSLKMGCSPRGALTLFRMTQARAFLSGRDHAIPEDVKAVAVAVLAHRLALDTQGQDSGVQEEDGVPEILAAVAVR